jgi:hypothetical protein
MNTRALLAQSIDQLESLAAFLADEVRKPPQRALAPVAEQRLCKEALLSISVLLPKLKAVRGLQPVPAEPPQRCPVCED